MSDNELIAEFMEVPKLKDGEKCVFDIRNTGKLIYCLDSKYLRYQTDWDWLMPVVEKISKLHDSKFHYDMDKIKNGDWPEDNEYMLVIAMPMATPISEAYETVVKFIKYYNETKP